MTTAPLERIVDARLDVPVESRRSVLREARDELRDVVRYRSLVGFLVSSSLRAEGSNTVLGVAWWVIDPMLLAAIYVVVVGGILGRGGEDFPIFILTALIAWLLFTKGARGAATTTMRKQRSMRQVAFPKSIVPLSRVLIEAVHFAFAFLVVLLAALPFGIYPSALALLVVPIALVQLAFTLGVAYFLSAINIFVRDATKVTKYLFRVWFYLSPAIYPVSSVPERFRDVYELNPFAVLFPAYRAIVMDHTLPDFGALAILAGSSLVMLVLGYLFFVRLQPWFAKFA